MGVVNEDVRHEEGELRRQSAHCGSSSLIEIITPGSMIGYLHPLSVPPQPRVTDTVVLSPEGAHLFVLAVEDFHAIRRDDPPLAVALLLCMLHRSGEEYTNHVRQQAF